MPGLTMMSSPRRASKAVNEMTTTITTAAAAVSTGCSNASSSPIHESWEALLPTLPTTFFPALQSTTTTNDTTTALNLYESDILTVAWDTLASASSRMHLPLSALVSGAWALVLSAYTAQRDVSFAYRCDAFPGLAPYRVRLDDHASVAAAFRAARTEALDLVSMDISDVQFLAFCNTAVVLDRTIGGSPTVAVDEASTSKFAVRLTITRSVDAIHASLHYNSSLVPVAAAKRIVDAFASTLEWSCIHISSRIPSTPILPSAERSILTDLASGPTTAIVDTELMHHAFERFAARFPDSVACEQDGGSLTYGQVDALASGLAQACHRRLVAFGSGTVVAVFVVREIMMVPAVMAVLKAGGVYVPIDASTPVDRVAHMIKEAGVQMMLVTEASTPYLPADAFGLPIISVDGFDASTSSEAVAFDQPKSSDPAYVVFTSGTTGLPKAVVVPHSGITNLLSSSRGNMGVEPSTRVGQFMSVAFDGCVWELFLALSSGATLVLRGEDPFATLKTLDTVLMTPTGLSKFEPEAYPNLKTVILGGEAVTMALVKRWGGRVKLFNAYGPSEIAVAATTTRLIPGEQITIGKPVSNRRCYILHPTTRQLLPRGVAGELCIAGPGIALGYMNNRDLTNAKFISDPFHAKSSEKMYLSGDLARWTVDGSLEFLGRIGNGQIKLRGYRMEKGEILSHIESHPSVFSAALIVRDDVLVAFVTPASVDVERLRTTVAKILPRYMVPGRFLAIDELPSTLNGKVDERKLAELAEGAGVEDVAITIVAPVNAVERALLSAMEQVLGGAALSTATTFWAAGGDSINAISFVQACKRHGWVLTVADVFQHETVVRLAAVAKPIADSPVSTVVDDTPYPLVSSTTVITDIFANHLVTLGVVPDDVEDVLPCTQLQEKLVAGLQSSRSDYTVSLAFSVDGSFSVSEFRDAWKGTVSRNSILRTRFAFTAEGIYQVVVRDGARDAGVDVEEVNAHWASSNVDAMQTAYMNDEYARGFDKDGASFMRCALVKILDDDAKQTSWRVVFTFFHGILDGWGFHSALQDIFEAYCGRPVVSRPAFGDFIRYSLDTVDLAADKSFWTSALDGYRPLPRLIAKEESTVASRHAMITRRYPTLQTRLAQLAKTSGVTVATTIRAAWALCLRQHYRTDDVMFGGVVSGRDVPVTGIDKMLGLLINTIPIRTRFSTNMTLDDLLRSVQTTHATTMSHSQASLVDIHQWQNVKTDMFALFHSMLTVQNFPQLDTTDMPFSVTYSDINEMTEFPLVLMVSSLGEDVHLSVSYDASVLTPEVAETAVQHFERVVDAMLDATALTIPLANVAAFNTLDADMSVGKALDVDVWKAGLWNDRVDMLETLSLPSSKLIPGSTDGSGVEHRVIHSTRAFEASRDDSRLMMLAAFNVLMSIYASSTDFVVVAQLLAVEVPLIVNLDNDAIKLIDHVRDLHVQIKDLGFVSAGDRRRACVKETNGLPVHFSFTDAASDSHRIAFSVSESSFTITYPKSKIDGWFVAQLGDHYATVLSLLSTATDISLVTVGDVRDAVSDTVAPVVRAMNVIGDVETSSLHWEFEAQVQRSPYAVAVQDLEGASLTYVELNERANRLARYLISRDVKVGDYVPLIMDKSLAMVVAILGVLKAGAAYVPLGLASPVARNVEIMEEIRATVLITSSSSVGTAMEAHFPSLTILKATSITSSCSGFTSTNVHLPSFTSENLAYLISSSGSTGKPKGICLPHASVCRAVRSFISECDLTPGSKVMQFAQYTFDMSVHDIFGALLHGHTLCLAPTDDLLSRPVEVIRSFGIQMLTVTPSFLVTLGTPEDLPSLEVVAVGGETVPASLIPVWASKTRLLNGYGPTGTTNLYLLSGTSQWSRGLTSLSTETAIWSTVQHCGPTTSHLSIGKRLATATTYVLDAQNRSLPFGVQGELCIGGPQLSTGSGYFLRDELTQEKFVKDPFNEGSRMYRSGDAVRMLKDGSIVFCGRIDFQGECSGAFQHDGHMLTVNSSVKLRGLRIELNECEHVASLHAEVAACICEVREDSRGEQQLVGFLDLQLETTRPPADISSSATGSRIAAEVKTLLASRLPPYMVPSVLLSISHLPLNVNGKIDRKFLKGLALPERAAVERRGPSTPTQAALHDAIRVMMNTTEHLDVSDNFSSLGINSLLMMRLVSVIEKVFNVRIKVSDIMRNSSIESLSTVIASKRPESQVLAEQVPSIIPAGHDDPIVVPASASQKRMWMAQEISGGDTDYNVPMLLRVDRVLDSHRLYEAVTLTSRRHAILRTTFCHMDDLMQIVSPKQSVPFKVLSVETQDAVVDVCKEESTRPFDLRVGPLATFTLFQCSGTTATSYLFVNLHHIICDDTSVTILFREIMEAYDGRIVSSTPPPNQFADFALREPTLDTGDQKLQLQYWTERLQGASSLDIPRKLETDPSLPRGTLGVVRRSVPEAVLARFLTNVRTTAGSDVGDFSAFFSALYLLGAKYTGQYDFTIATPVGGRTTSFAQDVIGFMSNTVVVRLPSSAPTQSLSDFVSTARNSVLEAFEHSDVPFETVVEALQRDLSQPLFNILFAFRNDSAAVFEDAIRMPWDFAAGSGLRSKCDLAFEVHMPVDGATEGAIVLGYDENCFDPWFMEQLASHYIQLLDTVAGASADIAIGCLPIISANEIEHGKAMNEIETISNDSTLVEEFESCVRAHPDRIAVEEYQGGAMTYAELNAKTNQLARALRCLGVQEGTHVCLLMPKTVEMIVSLVGILKSGSAYVPLLIDAPASRNAVIIAEAGARIIITTAEPSDDLRKECGGALFLPFSTLRGMFSQLPAENLNIGIQPAHLAYTIFTSGTTGTPKGVCIPHKSICAAVDSAWKDAEFPSDLRILQLSEYSFDASVMDIFGGLLHGSTVCVAAKDMLMGNLCAVISTLQINYLLLTPSLLCGFSPQDLPSLKHITVGGEACPQNIIDTWAGVTRLYQAYGPTETSVYATMTLVQPGSRGCLLGRRLRTVQAYVMDQAGVELVPYGCVGELYLGGRQCARGYLNREDLTAKTFVNNPFGEGKMYKTGDLARMSPDGDIVYVGRESGYTKLNGFRIEIAEIDSWTSTVPGVQKSLCLVHEDAAGNPTLVNFLDLGLAGSTVPECAILSAVEYPQTIEIIASARQVLQKSLPPYMVPKIFVPLSSIPITAHGKLDGKRLKTLQLAVADAVPTVVNETRDVTEETLHGLLLAILKRTAPIALDANIFSNGLTSLSGIWFISKIRKEFGIDLRYSDMLAHSSLRQLAQLVRGRMPAFEIAEAQNSALTFHSRRTVLEGASLDKILEFPASCLQERMYLAQKAMGDGRNNVGQLLVVDRVLDNQLLIEAVTLLQQQHPILRTTYGMNEHGAVVQRVHPVLPAMSVVLDQNCADRKDEAAIIAVAKLAAEKDMAVPFDLESGPIVRFGYLACSSTTSAFYFCVHHIATDQWAAGIIFKSLFDIYDRLQAGDDTVRGIQPGLSYVDYALWHEEQRATGAVDFPAQLTFWMQHLAGAEDIKLPGRVAPAPAGMSRNQAGDVEVCLAQEDVRMLNALCNDAGLTQFVAMHAVFNLALHVFAGAPEGMAVGSLVSNRDQIDTTEVVGFFLNTVATYQPIKETHTFLLYAAELNVTLQAMRNAADVPFEDVLEGLKKDANALCTAMFIETNQTKTEGVRNIRLRRTEAMFPLTFAVNKLDDGEVTVAIEFNAFMFDESKIRGLLSQFSELLHSVVSGPSTPVMHLNYLSPAEKQTILIDWNQWPASMPNVPLYESIETRMRENPNAIAIDFDGKEQMTYGELEARTNLLGQRLIDLGVGSNVPVALAMNKSIAFVVGAVATMRSFGTFVPIDPSNAFDRTSFIMRESKCRVVLTTSDLASKWAKLTDAFTFIMVDEILCASASNTPTLQRLSHFSFTDTAYILFTSGTTGKPKGAKIAQGGLSNVVRELCIAQGIDSSYRVMNVLPHTFDASMSDLFTALTCGATLCVVRHMDILADMAGAYRRMRGSCGVITPSALKLLPDPSSIPTLRAFIAGGEALTDQLVDLWADRIKLIHAYGPTECSIASHCKQMKRGETITIGKAIKNVRNYVVDSFMRPVPVGTYGELLIGGIQVGQGYLQTELNAATFIPSPFTDDGDILYRTGDIVRFLPNGEVQYLSRKGVGMVKVRGYRVEIGEVESTIAPLVRQVCVVLSADTLIAYVELDSTYSASDPMTMIPSTDREEVKTAIASIRAHVRATLPAYMVPSKVIVLSKLPLTNNSKIDRKTLEAFKEKKVVKTLPTIKISTVEPAQVPSSGLLSARILRMLAETIKCDIADVTIDEDVFSLGLTSLAGVRFAAALSRTFGKEISLTQLFHPSCSTVRGIAAYFGETEAYASSPRRGPSSAHVSDSEDTQYRHHGDDHSMNEVRGQITHLLAEALKCDESEVGLDEDLMGLGLGSLSGVRFAARLSNTFGKQVTISDLYSPNLGTVRGLAHHLCPAPSTPRRSTSSRHGRFDDTMSETTLFDSRASSPVPRREKTGKTESINSKDTLEIDWKAETHFDPSWIECEMQGDVSPVTTLEPAAPRRSFAAIRSRKSESGPRPILSPVSSTKVVLLTGASGFLGAHMLKDLIKRRIEVHCVGVRAGTDGEAHDRVINTLKKYKLLTPAVARRLKYVRSYAGDFETDRLGLSEEMFDALATRCRSVYHVGARVNHLEPYQRMKAANVSSLEWIIRFASRHHLKHIHFVSTISVSNLLPVIPGVNITRHQEAGAEEFLTGLTPDTEYLSGGYYKSKWAAEMILAQAKDWGLPITVYRPGYLTGSVKHGIGNGEGWVDALAILACRTGVYPNFPWTNFDLTPVDWAGKAIVAIALGLEDQASGHLRNPWKEDNTGMYHICNPVPVDFLSIGEKLATIRQRKYGQTITPIPKYQYLRLLQILADGNDRFAAALRPLMGSPEDHAAGGEEPAISASSCVNTLTKLRKFAPDLKCPKVTTKYVEVLETSWWERSTGK
ncbi:hypothetical protein HKX48_002208 [Thoreauomyces humboldtii]|nr:hypothetical protein HKX48_002208 [Thoreauomyces humboldtii]